MIDPVLLDDGYTFDRQNILKWFEKGNKINPLTGKEVGSKKLIPNRFAKSMIENYLEENKEKYKI